MARRKVINIDEGRCNGCGLCIPNCPEGAIRIIEGKARLVNDSFCDGLGACLGHCPQGAITIEEREAGEYDEYRVIENVVKSGERHIKGTCPGSRPVDLKRDAPACASGGYLGKSIPSQLGNWPVQIKLVPASAPYFAGADILVAADCVAFSYAGFHQDLLKAKVLLVGCPKLDDAQFYREKLAQIFRQNPIRSVTCAHMEVPCCFSLVQLARAAIADSAKDIPFKEVTLSIKGERLDEREMSGAG